MQCERFNALYNEWVAKLIVFRIERLFILEETFLVTLPDYAEESKEPVGGTTNLVVGVGIHQEGCTLFTSQPIPNLKPVAITYRSSPAYVHELGKHRDLYALAKYLAEELKIQPVVEKVALAPKLDKLFSIYITLVGNNLPTEEEFIQLLQTGKLERANKPYKLELPKSVPIKPILLKRVEGTGVVFPNRYKESISEEPCLELDFPPPDTDSLAELVKDAIRDRED